MESSRVGGGGSGAGLPRCSAAPATNIEACRGCESLLGDRAGCVFAGDSRVNEQPGLTRDNSGGFIQKCPLRVHLLLGAH